MKKAALISIMLCIVLSVQAQLKHYITIGKVFNENFFNKEEDKLEFILLLPISISYKIEREKWSAELWYTESSRAYHSIYSSEFNDILLIDNSIVCINIQYVAFQHKRISMSPFAGLIYRDYHSKIFEGWRIQNQFHEPYPVFRYEDENQIGFQTGVNINLPIYWGIYANSNLRYNAIPWAKYNKQNFVAEVGLGYKIQRKKKTEASKNGSE